MTAPDDALARALALLCLEGRGKRQHRLRRFLVELRAVLPPDHPGHAMSDPRLVEACDEVRDHLAEAYGVSYQRKLRDPSNTRMSVRLCRPALGPPTD
ncbi:hypothetical protein [Micromonospora sp. NPDC004551]|uniref:hypothetical protein n=1 Tax=Micromonospora sp. NPDC004551 TaxID=3154284 RepID=UPI0033B48EC8